MSATFSGRGVVVGERRLRRRRGRRLPGAAAAQLRDVAEPQPTRRDVAGGRHAQGVGGQQSHVAVEREDDRAAHGGLEPAAVVIRGVVVADARVVPAGRRDEAIARPVGHEQPLQPRVEGVSRQRCQRGLGEHAQPVGELRLPEQVELAEREAVSCPGGVDGGELHVAEQVDAEPRLGRPSRPPPRRRRSGPRARRAGCSRRRAGSTGRGGPCGARLAGRRGRRGRRRGRRSWSRRRSCRRSRSWSVGPGSRPRARRAGRLVSRSRGAVVSLSLRITAVPCCASLGRALRRGHRGEERERENLGGEAHGPAGEGSTSEAAAGDLAHGPAIASSCRRSGPSRGTRKWMQEHPSFRGERTVRGCGCRLTGRSGRREDDSTVLGRIRHTRPVARRRRRLSVPARRQPELTAPTMARITMHGDDEPPRHEQQEAEQRARDDEPAGALRGGGSLDRALEEGEVTQVGLEGDVRRGRRRGGPSPRACRRRRCPASGERPPAERRVVAPG